jgi:hypothetical protein
VADDALKIVIDPEALSWGDIEDLEQASSLRAIGDWLAAHGGVDRSALRGLPAPEVRDFISRVRDQLKAALDIPK